MARCSVCKTPILELPKYKYCECSYCEGHEISGYKMGCKHHGAVDMLDMMNIINSYRSGALDEVIRSYKEDKTQREGTKERVRPVVEEVVEEVNDPPKKSS